MESTANINNTNTTGIFNEIPIKIRYKLNGTSITENLGLYNDLNLDAAFNEFQAKKKIPDINNTQKEKVFYLIKDNKKKILDKNKKVQELDLKEGDLIEVNHPTPEIKNEIFRHNIQNSETNLNEPLPPSKKKNYALIIGIIIGIFILSLTISLCVCLIPKKKKKKIESQNSDEIMEPKEEEENEKDDQEDVLDNFKMTKKNYSSEELITEKSLIIKRICFLYIKEKK